MSGDTDFLVLRILVPLFLLVGLYLIWYSRHRKKMLEAFAKNHRFRIRPERENELRKTLDDCFKLEEKGLVRNFDQLSSLVDATPVWLFRAVELLDLNPHAQAYSTHLPRVAAVFDIQNDYEVFFILDQSGQAYPRIPGSKSIKPVLIDTLNRIIRNCTARHPLSVTFKNGHALLYFEPMVTGGETLEDVESLYCVARHVRTELLQNV